MKMAWRTYAVLAAVLAGSLALTWVGRATGVWDAVYSAPGFLALFGALYQLVRDEAAHIKGLALQHDQQKFALGVTSHMADIAFDRHVALCDEFVSELFQTLQCLMDDPKDHASALKRADALGNAIRKHAVWVTPELQARLEEFERAVREIAQYTYGAERHPDSFGSQKPLDLLLDLIDPGSAPGTPPKRDLLYRQIIDLGRQMLGVNELTNLRAALLNRDE